MKNQILSLLKKFGPIMLMIAVAYAVGRYAQPPEIKTEIKMVEKVVERIKKDIVIVEREIKNPDGTTTIDRRTEDRSTETSDRSSRSEEKTQISAAKKWRAGAGVKTQISNLTPSYGVGVGYRVLGPFWIDVAGYSDGTATAHISFEF